MYAVKTAYCVDMLFNSLEFFIFFMIVIIIYFLLPKKYTWIWLLLSSYYFYTRWNASYALLILISTLITFLSGILIDRSKSIERKKLFVALSFLSNLAILGYFKYYNFFAESINSVLSNVNVINNIPLNSVLLPVGISFYTFQALSYTVDVYRGDVSAEYHFGHYALFVSFFPQLVAGPIEKSKNLLPQIKKGIGFDYYRFKEGLLIIGWGLMKKMIIADRIAVAVDSVYNNIMEFSGFALLVATLLFSIQIYCDFSAYSDIAIGCAKIMGYDLMINFRRPYFAKSIREFWSRWHISLSTWFKEYLYIPLGGSRKKVYRTYINLLLIFVISGLWHGANWTFVIWGALHGCYQLFGRITSGFRHKLNNALGIKEDTYGYRFARMIVTNVLVIFAWIFFRANNVQEASYIIRNISFSGTSKFVTGGYTSLGLDIYDILLSLFGIILLIIIDIFIEKNDVLSIILNENLISRWILYGVMFFSILILGYYGGYDAKNFIYFQF